MNKKPGTFCTETICWTELPLLLNYGPITNYSFCILHLFQHYVCARRLVGDVTTAFNKRLSKVTRWYNRECHSSPFIIRWQLGGKNLQYIIGITQEFILLKCLAEVCGADNTKKQFSLLGTSVKRAEDLCRSEKLRSSDSITYWLRLGLCGISLVVVNVAQEHRNCESSLRKHSFDNPHDMSRKCKLSLKLICIVICL